MKKDFIVRLYRARWNEGAPPETAETTFLVENAAHADHAIAEARAVLALAAGWKNHGAAVQAYTPDSPLLRDAGGELRRISL